MESQEAIMENENNSNLESESINRERLSSESQPAQQDISQSQSETLDFGNEGAKFEQEAEEKQPQECPVKAVADSNLGSGAAECLEQPDVATEDVTASSELQEDIPLADSLQGTTESTSSNFPGQPEADGSYQALPGSFPNDIDDIISPMENLSSGAVGVSVETGGASSLEEAEYTSTAEVMESTVEHSATASQSEDVLSASQTVESTIEDSMPISQTLESACERSAFQSQHPTEAGLSDGPVAEELIEEQGNFNATAQLAVGDDNTEESEASLLGQTATLDSLHEDVDSRNSDSKIAQGEDVVDSTDTGLLLRHGAGDEQDSLLGADNMQSNVCAVEFIQSSEKEKRDGISPESVDISVVQSSETAEIDVPVSDDNKFTENIQNVKESSIADMLENPSDSSQPSNECQSEVSDNLVAVGLDSTCRPQDVDSSSSVAHQECGAGNVESQISDSNMLDDNPEIGNTAQSAEENMDVDDSAVVGFSDETIGNIAPEGNVHLYDSQNIGESGDNSEAASELTFQDASLPQEDSGNVPEISIQARGASLVKDEPSEAGESVPETTSQNQDASLPQEDEGTGNIAQVSVQTESTTLVKDEPKETSLSNNKPHEVPSTSDVSSEEAMDTGANDQTDSSAQEVVVEKNTDVSEEVQEAEKIGSGAVSADATNPPNIEIVPGDDQSTGIIKEEENNTSPENQLEPDQLIPESLMPKSSEESMECDQQVSDNSLPNTLEKLVESSVETNGPAVTPSENQKESEVNDTDNSSLVTSIAEGTKENDLQKGNDNNQVSKESGPIDESNESEARVSENLSAKSDESEPTKPPNDSDPAITSNENDSAKKPNENVSEISPEDTTESNKNDPAKTPSENETATGESPMVEARNIKQEVITQEEASQQQATPKSEPELLKNIKSEAVENRGGEDGPKAADDDIVVLDDEGLSIPVKREPEAASEIGPVTNGDASSAGNKNGPQKGATKKSKPKLQKCIVCLQVVRCKYNIVRNGDIKHLCGDECFNNFKRSPSIYLRPPEKKTCKMCHLININPKQPFCTWQGLDFCGETCLGKFQATLGTTCSMCNGAILDSRTAITRKIGNDMRIFCRFMCCQEFQKKVRLCAFCQKDLSSVQGAFSAMVGSQNKKVRQFCSQSCRASLEAHITNIEVLNNIPGQAGDGAVPCSVCQKVTKVKHTVRFNNQMNHLCSDLCLNAFRYTNKIGLATCSSCGGFCTSEEAQTHIVQHEGATRRFCGDSCLNTFRVEHSRLVSCGWCQAKKLNFEMIERLGTDNKIQMFCTLNCLSLYRVNLQAKSNQAVPCDQCSLVLPAQYHLTMSDATVRNFCSYPCVIMFQSKFSNKQVAPGNVPGLAVMASAPHATVTASPTQVASLLGKPTQSAAAPRGRGRPGTRATNKQPAAASKQAAFPVISSVMSLAPPPGVEPSPSPPTSQSPQATQSTQAQASGAPNTLASGDLKTQIIIQAPPVKIMKNKTAQCRPVTMTKATSCKPHSQPKETQTEKIPPTKVMIPVPVPIYIPMPTVMYSAPVPYPVPIPIPIPVPVFIPTTRKSSAGIMKAISEIVERMPSDPLEAELLMMAEAAVATDKKESESESEPEDFGLGFDDQTSEPPAAVQAEPTPIKPKAGEEDMIQMALRMAEEMSAPVADLESSVDMMAVNTDPPIQQQQVAPAIYHTPQPLVQVEDEYIPPGSRPGRGRGGKRARGRGAATGSPRAKRQRVERSYREVDEEPTQQIQQPVVQQLETAADASYRLKFTYGVNAWRHWVLAKNAQIESEVPAGHNQPYRVRTFPTDILKCTTDQLNMSLIMFIKEVRKPNGDPYSADSIFYLCLGIQQYLYENGRIDSIFTDSYFERFSDSLHQILKNLQPKVNAQGQMLCRIEEEHLWESKQLGAHSPFVLLNTLIYFHTKHFILKTPAEHMALSFAQILKHWKKGVPLKGSNTANTKNISLRFYCLANGKKDMSMPRKREGVPVYEITENLDNPLRCPVKLYEFFLSKCPESIKNRNDIFYPVPERSCVPDSPVWYSTQSIGVHSMEKMLTRVLLVREIQEAHLHTQPICM